MWRGVARPASPTAVAAAATAATMSTHASIALLVVAAVWASAATPADRGGSRLPPSQAVPPKGARCQETPTIAEKLEKDITECQEEIKLSILKEVLEQLDAPQGEAAAALAEAAALAASRRRVRRQAIQGDDRRIAGCLLQCVYRRVGAVDSRGFPVTAGLVQLYAAGAANEEYRSATAYAVQDCQLQSYQRRLAELTSSANAQNAGTPTCELAFDIFECVSERIEQYCLGGA